MRDERQLEQLDRAGRRVANRDDRAALLDELLQRGEPVGVKTPAALRVLFRLWQRRRPVVARRSNARRSAATTTATAARSGSGRRRRGGRAAASGRIAGRGRITAAATTASAAATTHAERLFVEDQDVVLRLEIAGIQVGRKHVVFVFDIRHFEVLEDQARPADGHAAADMVDQPDARTTQLGHLPSGRGRRGVEGDAELGGNLLQHGAGRWLVGDVERPRSERTVGEPVHVFTGGDAADSPQ